MKVLNIEFNSVVHRLRGQTSFNGGLSFTVRISRRVNFTIHQLKNILNRLAARLSQTTFYPLIKDKPINILIVSESDMEKIGLNVSRNVNGIVADRRYSAPETIEPQYPLGVYDPFVDAVLINCEVYRRRPSDIEVLMHELLHAYSSGVIKVEGDNIVTRTGIATIEIRGRHREETAIYLSEGLTEYLKVKTGGIKPKGFYRPAYDAIETLVRHIGEDVLIEAYFSGKTDILSKAVNAHYGGGAYEQLLDISFLSGLQDRDQHDIELLKGFLDYGFEYPMMEDWGFSPENRFRAPRRLATLELSAALQAVVQDLNIQIYTNLTPDELTLLFDHIGHEEKHRLAANGIPHGNYSHLRSLLKNAESIGQNLLFIRYATDYQGKRLALINDAFVEPRDMGSPNFLGKVYMGCLLCEVYL